ncbi:transketolase family protein [Candidatus Amesbacteria bacterium]|nr:transketolase family protein [Candidatus Amesbacteria bacterium]
MPNSSLSLSQFSNQKARSTRDGFGEALVELGEVNKNIIVLTADLTESTKVADFAKKFPERFIECGVAEQNMAGIAAGLAACGKIPFITSYAVFSPGRNWDQIRVSICYSNLPVKIIGCHTGLSVGPDGATHQALEDIALMRVLPNMTVVVPCDAIQAKQATIEISKIPGSCYLRLTREVTPIITQENSKFQIGHIDILENYGQDVAIIACGPLVYQALVAAKELNDEGIKTTIINNHTIKPLDKAALLKVARDCGAVVTVEEHQVAGGMGSAVSELFSANYPIPMEFIGMQDSFGESGDPDQLLAKYGMSVAKIKEMVKKVIIRKPSYRTRLEERL